MTPQREFMPTGEWLEELDGFFRELLEPPYLCNMSKATHLYEIGVAKGLLGSFEDFAHGLTLTYDAKRGKISSSLFYPGEIIPMERPESWWKRFWRWFLGPKFKKKG